MLSVIVLSFTLPRVDMLNIIMMSVVILSVMMLIEVMMNVILLSLIMLRVVLNIMLNLVKLSGLYYKSFTIIIYFRNDSTIVEPLL